MEPALAWQSVLDQLQLEMPRQSFESWVRDTELISCEDELVTIACQNAYAADWLENRLASTVSHMLAGMLNRLVEVRFIVRTNPDDDETPEADEPETKPEGAQTLIPVDGTRYQNEVHPERVVVIPGYTLRLLEQGDLVPRQLSLWLGFRQAVAAWKGDKPLVRKVRNQEAIKFAMMSRAAFFREIEGQDEIAGGLVERIALPENKSTDSKGRWYQNANTYRVQAMPFLASGDAACIEQLLQQALSDCVTRDKAASTVTACLERLANTDPAEWLQDTGKKNPARRVLQIARQVLEIKGDLPIDLADAAERVQDRLLGAFGQVVISHYFLLTLAPYLGLSHAQTWAVIALRDRCWYDHETHAQHDFAIVHGGIKALAGWVGTSEKSVLRWLADSRFTCLANSMNVPDLPENWKANGTLVLRVRQLEILVSDLTGQSETPVTDKVRLASGQTETQNGQSETPVLDKMRLESGQSETLLNNLIQPHFKTSITPKTKTTTGSANNSHASQNEQVAAVANLETWDKTILLNNLRVSPKTRAKLTGVEAWQITSWLLYANSLAGYGIKIPENYALARAAENRCGAGGDYDDFARKSPADLVDLILRTPKIFPQGNGTGIPAWDKAMGLANDRIHRLLPILTGVD
jgi:hypothetical protein